MVGSAVKTNGVTSGRGGGARCGTVVVQKKIGNRPNTAVGLESAKDLLADLDQALRHSVAGTADAVVAPVDGDGAVEAPDYNDEGCAVERGRSQARVAHVQALTRC